MLASAEMFAVTLVVPVRTTCPEAEAAAHKRTTIASAIGHPVGAFMGAASGGRYP